MPVDPHQLTPRLNYPATTTFGQRLNLERSAKQHVAAKVAEQFLPPGVRVFIGDGSSTFYVGLALLHLARSLTQHEPSFTAATNSLAIAGEYVFGQGEPRLDLRTSQGEVSRLLFASFGDHTRGFAQDCAEGCECSILSVRSLLAREGPYGVEHESLEVKRTVLLNSKFRRLVLVADHTKLAAVPDAPDAAGLRVLTEPGAWDALMSNPNVFVVTTKYPDAPATGAVTRIPSGGLDSLEPRERYSYQARLLREAMGRERFIEVVPYPCAQCPP